MKVNAKSRPTRTGVMVDVGKDAARTGEAALRQENRLAIQIRGQDFTARGGPSPERCEGERRR